MKENTELYDVEVECARLQDELGGYKLKLLEIQEDIALINRKLKTHQPKSKFESLDRRRDALKQDHLLIQKSSERIKSELRQWQAMSTDLRAKTMVHLDLDMTGNKDVIVKIKSLRTRYLDFAEDQTRVNSMRVMAAQFANELTSLISES